MSDPEPSSAPGGQEHPPGLQELRVTSSPNADIAARLERVAAAFLNLLVLRSLTHGAALRTAGDLVPPSSWW